MVNGMVMFPTSHSSTTASNSNLWNFFQFRPISTSLLFRIFRFWRNYRSGLPVKIVNARFWSRIYFVRLLYFHRYKNWIWRMKSRSLVSMDSKTSSQICESSYHLPKSANPRIIFPNLRILAYHQHVWICTSLTKIFWTRFCMSFEISQNWKKLVSTVNVSPHLARYLNRWTLEFRVFWKK